MKKAIIFVLLCCLSYSGWAQTDLDDATRQRITMEPAHAHFDWMMDDPNIQILNGIWKFHGESASAHRLLKFHSINYDDASWDQIPVPSADCPPGSYRKEFHLPADWIKREVFIHFGAVNFSMRLWINGQIVGESQGGQLPLEFRVTDYITEGKNILALQIDPPGGGSGREDSECMPVSGITRDVFIYSSPKLTIRDFFARPRLIDNYHNGRLDLEVDLRHYQEKRIRNYLLEVQLADADGREVIPAPLSARIHMKRSGNKTVRFTHHVIKPLHWTAETPNLYTLIMTLKDPDGKVIDSRRQAIGFRNIELNNRQLSVNGTRVSLKMVNRLSCDSVSQQLLSRESMTRDILLLKQNNVNAVQIGHYPADPYWYQLCDIFGLYVIQKVPAEQKEQLIQTIRNHPSVIPWSSREGTSLDAPWLNELIFPDGRIAPKLLDVKRSYQNIDFQPIDLNEGRIRIQNSHHFMDLTGHELHYSVLYNGEPIHTGVYDQPLSVKPGKSMELVLDLPPIPADSPNEYFLNLRVCLSAENTWAARGHEVAAAQFQLPVHQMDLPVRDLSTFPELTVLADSGYYTIAGSDFRLLFNKRTGFLDSWTSHGKEMLDLDSDLVPGPMMILPQEPAKKGQEITKTMTTLGLDSLVSQLVHMDLQRYNHRAVQLTVLIRWYGRNRAYVDHYGYYTILGNGTVHLANQLQLTGWYGSLPAAGTRLVLNDTFKRVKWYGRGPRVVGQIIEGSTDFGLYEESLAGTYLPYLNPEEASFRQEARWLELFDNQGFGLVCVPDKPLDFSVLPHLQMKANGLAFGVSLIPVQSDQERMNALNERMPIATMPEIVRDPDGFVNISAGSILEDIRFTLNGKDPKKNSESFLGDFVFSKGGTVKARHFGDGLIPSGIAIANFELSKNGWQVIQVSSEVPEREAYRAIDGNPNTFWQSGESEKSQTQSRFIVVDLGRRFDIRSVKYTPRQDRADGRIGSYRLYLSTDGVQWGTPVEEGRFQNTAETQEIILQKNISSRYLRLEAKDTFNDNKFVSIGEIDIVIDE